MLLPMESKIEKMFSSPKGKLAYGKCLKALSDYSMYDKLHSGVVVGFSGGADSVFLLSFLTEYLKRNNCRVPLVACHVEHGIRAEEAIRDLEFSRAFCQSLQVEFFEFHFDVPSIASNESIGLEEAGRNARYSAFHEIINSRNDIGAIAVAHNSTDNAETCILNILRGSGGLGASGIPPVRDNIIRPLIYLAKSEILSLLDESGIEYVVDSSNFSSDYSRNYIRNEILPMLRHINDNVEDAFSKLSSSLRIDNAYISSYAEDIVAKNDNALPIELLRNLDAAVLSRVLILFCQKNGASVNSKQIAEISRLIIKDSFSVTVIGGFDFVCSMGICRLVGNEKKENDFSLVLKLGLNPLPGYNGAIALVKGGDKEFLKTYLNVYNFSIFNSLSSVIIEGSLRVRFKLDGDAYRYGGMHHKLKKVFNDRSVPAFERNNIPVVCDDKGIVWVPGLPCRDDGVKNADSLSIALLIKDPSEEDGMIYTAIDRNKNIVKKRKGTEDT